jgi:hypothetical protein
LEFAVSLAVLLAVGLFVALRLTSKDECSCGEVDEKAGNLKERD